MILTLVRHGQTLSNESGTWQGRGNSPLSPVGHEQAQLLAGRLQGLEYDRVVTSDLGRARETANAVGKPYDCDPAFREIHLGRWEGLTRAQVHFQFPEEVSAMERGEPVRIGGGESWADVERRVLSGLEPLRDAGEVLLITHGGVILTLMCALVGRGVGVPRPFGRLLNASVSVIELGPASVVHRYNDADHCDADGVWREAARRGHDVAVQDQGGDPGRVGEARLGRLDPGRCGLIEASRDRTVMAAWNVLRPTALSPSPAA
jgi:probable phosphoglycerate mutase